MDRMELEGTNRNLKSQQKATCGPSTQLDLELELVPLEKTWGGALGSRHLPGERGEPGPPGHRALRRLGPVSGAGVQHLHLHVAVAEKKTGAERLGKTNGIPFWLVGEFTTHFCVF